MDANELRTLQAPLKKQHREQPATALTPARAEAMLDMDRIVCRVGSWLGARIRQRLARSRRDVDNGIVGEGDIGLVRAQHLGEIPMQPIVAHAAAFGAAYARPTPGPG